MQGVQPKNIFIVDDDPMISEMLRDYLVDHWSHNVTMIGTGEECLARMHENPDIIILDYILNSVHKDAVDGIEILHFIKVNYPKIRIIMLSGREQLELVTQSLQQGAEKYVLKTQDAFDQIADLVNVD
jgi:two-component system, OmpR family, response regulator